jgi:hypothetical protein
VCQSTIGTTWKTCKAQPYDADSCGAGDPCVPYNGSGLVQANTVVASGYAGTCTACGEKVMQLSGQYVSVDKILALSGANGRLCAN